MLSSPFQKIQGTFLPGRQSGARGRKPFLVIKLYIISFPITSSIREELPGKPQEQRSESNPRETFNSSWKKIDLAVNKKECTGPYIMLLIIRHTRSNFFEHSKSKVRAVAFQQENSKSPVDKRLLQQSLTFTNPQKSQLLNPKGLRGQHWVNRNITVRIKTEFLPYASSCRRWGIFVAREIRNYSISNWQISWFNRLKADVPIYLRVWF